MNNNKSNIFLLAIIVTLAIIIRIVFFNTVINHPISLIDTHFKQMDMYGNIEWAGKIVNGDYLSKDTWHPYHKWMQDIAPISRWHKWWHGEKIFHRAPLYPYFLAASINIFKSHLPSIRWLQHLIGIFSVILIFMISLEISGRTEAFISSLLAALYFPFLCFEFHFLRDFMAMNFLLIFILIIAKYVKNQKNIYIFLAGLFCGISILIRENMLILIPAFIILILFNKITVKNKVSRILIYISGILLSLIPLFIRNIIVDAPLLSLSNRFIESLIEGNAFDSSVYYMYIPESMKRYLSLGEGNILTTIKLIINDYPSFYLILKMELLKFISIFSCLEPYNNINLYYYLETFWWLNLLPDYASISLLSLAGFFLYIRQNKSKFLLIIFASMVCSLMIAPILARYRLILIPFFLIFTGISGNFLFEKIFKKSIKKTILTLIIILSLSSFIINHSIIDNTTKQNIAKLKLLCNN